MTACFSSRINSSNTFTHIKLAFGGMAAYTIAAKKTEDYITGKSVSSATLQGAIDLLAEEFALSFTVPGGMASFRRTLAISFLFKYFVEVASQCGVSLDEVEGVSEGEKANLTEVSFTLTIFSSCQTVLIDTPPPLAHQTRYSNFKTRQQRPFRQRSSRKTRTALFSTQSHHRERNLPRRHAYLLS